MQWARIFFVVALVCVWLRCVVSTGNVLQYSEDQSHVPGMCAHLRAQLAHTDPRVRDSAAFFMGKMAEYQTHQLDLNQVRTCGRGVDVTQ
jgi:hypothetical protein